MPTNDRNPNRILHIFGAMDCGGAETLIMNVYRKIDRAAMQFDFAVDTNRRCYYDREIERLGGRIFHLPHPATAGLRAYNRALAGILHEHGPFAAVHSHIHHFSGLVLRAAEQAHVPARVAHSHTTSDGQAASWMRRAYRWSMTRLLRRHATHLLGCSRAACEALFGQACWHDARVSVLPNAINLDHYAHDDDRHALRTRLALPAGCPVIAHVGSFTAVKNHGLLIDIFAALLRHLPNAQLVLAGDGPLRPRIIAQIRARGIERSVHLLGVRDDVPAILGAADLFAFPSLYEGLGIVVIEAQAAGLPTVVADAVPPEADMRLGLVRRVPTQADAGRWVEHILAGLSAPRPGWPTRWQALRTAGYDIRAATQRLEQVYTFGKKGELEGATPLKYPTHSVKERPL